ncbi:PAS domain-containing hybrid sensor histidine kinase/response regulator [Aquabacterium sp.]|uniref:sensor histidine kinase n=1 Tax=Aquabacterium sp. TaxID=1872578 RepID=UPI002489F0CB|nr:PAS domain-containing hybrid sensor histidine kinase/response regulator [Aquabacterium sp.]MDI1261267.1 ATP-binding protein [Aquabacterium sp.]
MNAPRTNSNVASALSLVAQLHRQTDHMRAELRHLRQDMAQVKNEFNETHGAHMLEANENLVMAVLHAETVAETAVSDLGELACSSQRDALLRLAIESANIGEWEMDLSSGAMIHSLRHDMCFGHHERQLEWSVDAFLKQVHPDDRDEVAQGLAQATRQLSDWQAVCRVVWPDASTHWISIRGGIFHDSGHPARLLGIITDVTEVRQAEASRHQLEGLALENRQMLEASRLKSQFISNMSHELRTPLNAIIGFSDLLVMGLVPEGSPKQKEYLGHIGGSARHLLHLINDVLDMSKVESGKFEFFPEPVDLRQLVSELGDVLHTALQRKSIQFNMKIDEAVKGLVIDPARLKQVLYNYLSNAIKFTPSGGQVTVSAHSEGPDQFRLEIEDTGIGIAQDDLPRLFVDFQQLDAGYSKLHQGTGLGLALTRRLVEAQGGSVGARSTLGLGSVFHVVLDRVHPVHSGGAA